MKYVFLLFALTYATQISIPYVYSSGDTLFSPAKENANNAAIKNVVNGNIKDDNIHSEAAIDQNKIDSTTGWLTNAVGTIKTVASNKQIRSPKGISFFVNDSTVYNENFRFISDSTDTNMVIYPDSVKFYKPIAGDIVLTGDIYTTDSTDYFSACTTYGWSDSSGYINIRRIGDLAFVDFYITGTSTTTSAFFTMPWFGRVVSDFTSGICYDNDALVAEPCRIAVGGASTSCVVYKGWTDTAASWTASGTKTVSGTFFYWIIP